MKKILFFSALALCVGMASCSDDDDLTPSAGIATSNGGTEVMQFDTLTLAADVKNVATEEANNYVWKVNGTEVGRGKTYKFVQAKVGSYELELTVTDGAAATPLTTKQKLTVTGRFGEGAFLLNEGNFGNETGTLTYIDGKKGVVIDSAYYRVNGTLLGNVCQNLFIANDKMYIISQNGAKNGGEGLLTIANAKTLEKISVLSPKELDGKMPTHVAVIGNNIYVRANNGIHLIDKNNAVSLIEGTEQAKNSPMAVIGNKLYAQTNGNQILVIEGKAVASTIEVAGAVSGIVKAQDGNLWVSTLNPNTIAKINASDNKLMDSHALKQNITAGWGAIAGFSAKGTNIYFCDASDYANSTKIFKHDFAANTTTEIGEVAKIITDSKMFYNSLAVDPETEEIYFASLKGWGPDYKVNNTTIFTLNGNSIAKKYNFEGVNSFPAGIYFVANFK